MIVSDVLRQKTQRGEQLRYVIWCSFRAQSSMLLCSIVGIPRMSIWDAKRFAAVSTVGSLKWRRSAFARGPGYR